MQDREAGAQISMSFDFFTPDDAEQTLANSKKFASIKDLILNLKPKPGEELVYTVRPFGFAHQYVQASPFRPIMKMQPDGTEKPDREAMEFTDADTNKSFYRRGVKDSEVGKYGECPYKKAGYCLQDRWAMNVLVMNEDGTMRVAVMDGPKSLFEPIWNFQKANKDRNKSRKTPGKYCENVGGLKSHELEVKAAPAKKGKGADYTIQFLDGTEMDDEQIEQIMKSGKRSDVEIAAIRKQYAGTPIADAPDWMFCGPDLSKIFKPQLPGQSNATSRTSNEGQEEDGASASTTATSTSARTRTKASSTVKPAEADEDMFGDVSTTTSAGGTATEEVDGEW
jgi:hypothetical protein